MFISVHFIGICQVPSVEKMVEGGLHALRCVLAICLRVSVLDSKSKDVTSAEADLLALMLSRARRKTKVSFRPCVWFGGVLQVRACLGWVAFRAVSAPLLSFMVCHLEVKLDGQSIPSSEVPLAFV